MFCAKGIPGTKQIKISQNKQTEKLNIDIDAWLSFCFTCNMNLYNQFLLPHHCFHGSSPIGHGNSLFSRLCSPKHRAPFKWCLWAVLALITSQLSPVPLGDNHNPHSTQGHVAGPPASLMQPHTGLQASTLIFFQHLCDCTFSSSKLCSDVSVSLRTFLPWLIEQNLKLEGSVYYIIYEIYKFVNI